MAQPKPKRGQRMRSRRTEDGLPGEGELDFGPPLQQADLKRLGAEFDEAAKPVREALRSEGLPYQDFGAFVSLHGARHFRRERFDYKKSVPILLAWLPRVRHPGVKEAIVRSLSTRHAKPVAAQPLISELESTPDEHWALKWAIGNALSVVADETVFDSIARLAFKKEHGRAREMVVVALGNMRNPKAVDLLIRLTEDPEVCGHAVLALRKLAPAKARRRLQQLLDHPKTWVRNEAKKALERIDRAEAQR